MEWVTQKIKSDQTWDIASKVGTAALSIGLAVGGTLRGGLVGAAMAWGAFGTGVIGAANETDQYFTNQAGANTSIDPNKSVVPQDMQGHWGWVVASWVGVGLDFGAAVQATRLMKAGMEVEQVAKLMKAQKLPTRGLEAGEAADKAHVLEATLKDALPQQVAAQANNLIKTPQILKLEDFVQRFGSESADAVTTFTKGQDGVTRAQVFFREGGNPLAIREEAVHISQLAEGGDTAKKIGLLTEENLAKWPKMSTGQRLDIYKAKIEVEIDAQQRLLKQFGEGDPQYVRSVQHNLENLKARMAEVDLGVKNPKAVEDADWLQEAQAPRLFSKSPEVPLSAENLGLSQDRFEALKNVVSDNQIRRLHSNIGSESLSSLAKREPKAIQSYAHALELSESDPVAREALARLLPPSKVVIPGAKFEECIKEVEGFLQKYHGRVSGDFPERFGRKFIPKGDKPQAEGELRLAENFLDGKTIEGKNLKVEGLVARKDVNGKVIDGEQLPEYRIVKPNGSSFIAEVKTIESSLGKTNLQGNLKKAISQIKEEAGRTGEKGGYIRIDASASSSNLTNEEIGRMVKGQLLTADNVTGAKGSDFVGTVEILYKDASGSSKKLLTTIQDGQVTISSGDK